MLWNIIQNLFEKASVFVVLADVAALHSIVCRRLTKISAKPKEMMLLLYTIPLSSLPHSLLCPPTSSPTIFYFLCMRTKIYYTWKAFNALIIWYEILFMLLQLVSFHTLFFHPYKFILFSEHQKSSLSHSPPPPNNRFLRCVVLYIEIDFAGYNRLLMCSLIPPKTQNRCFCIIYRHTKMTFFYFNLTLTPNHCCCPHTQKCYYNCVCSDKAMDACMWNFGLKAQFF